MKRSAMIYHRKTEVLHSGFKDDFTNSLSARNANARLREFGDSFSCYLKSVPSA